MDKLSNFYTDYSNDYQQFINIIDIYNGVADIMGNYINQIKNNTIVSKIETYRTVPFQSADVYEATYEIGVLLSSMPIMKLLGLTEISIQERIDRWSNPENENYISIESKVKALEMSGKYILLLAKRNEKLDQVNASVIDLKLFNENNHELTRDVDFVLKDNKIYLLGDASRRFLGKTFTMKNIMVDFNTPEDLIGKNVNMAYNRALTKNEYREMAQMLLYSSIGGPTIKNIKNAIQAISGMKGVEVVDKYSNDPVRSQYWNSTERADRLHEFDFLIALPDEIEDIDKMIIFIKYLKTMRPAYTNFFVSTMKHMIDIMILKQRDKRDLKVNLFAFEYMNINEMLDLNGITLTLKDVLQKLEIVRNIISTPNIIESIKGYDTISSDNFGTIILQNDPAFDKILIRDVDRKHNLDKNMKDIKINPGIQTQWLCDSGNLMDDEVYECDIFDNFDYSKPLYYDHVNIKLLNNMILNGGFTAGKSYWTLSPNAEVYPGRLVMTPLELGDANYQYINVSPETTYFLSVAQSDKSNFVLDFYSGSTYIGTELSLYGNSINNAFVTPSNCDRVKITLRSDFIKHIHEVYYMYMQIYNGDFNVTYKPVTLKGFQEYTSQQTLLISRSGNVVSPLQDYNFTDGQIYTDNQAIQI